MQQMHMIIHTVRMNAAMEDTSKTHNGIPKNIGVDSNDERFCSFMMNDRIRQKVKKDKSESCTQQRLNFSYIYMEQNHMENRKY